MFARTILLTFCLLVAACGGSATSSSDSSSGVTPSPTRSAHVNSVDACTLVTATEASTAAGSTLTNLSTSAGGQTGICIYGSSDSSSSASVFVFAQVYPDETTADAISPEQMAAVLSGQMGVANAKAVTGIGDKAFEYTATSSAGGGIAIFVFKANVVLMIVVSPTTDSAKVEALARAAVGRF